MFPFAPMARLIAFASRIAARTLALPGCTCSESRRMTWSAVRAAKRGRALCDTSARSPFGLRPAPGRAPPQLGLCRLRRPAIPSLSRELPVRQESRDGVAQVPHGPDLRQLLVGDPYPELFLEVTDKLHDRHGIHPQRGDHRVRLEVGEPAVVHLERCLLEHLDHVDALRHPHPPNNLRTSCRARPTQESARCLATARRVLPPRPALPMLPFRYCSRVLRRCSFPEEVLGSVPGGTTTMSATESCSSSPTRATILAFSEAGSSACTSTVTTVSSDAGPGRVKTTELPRRTPGVSSTSHSMT